MTRGLLLLAILLLALILADTLRSRSRKPVPADTTVAPHHPSAPPKAPKLPSAPAPGSSPDRISPMERLARLEVRRRLRAEGEQTYLDSLVSGTDSLLRRWPDPKPVTLRVAILPGDVAGYAPKMADFVREALERWETVGIGVAFRVVADTAGADVTVRWIEQFSRDRDGQTDVTWDRQGVIHHASIVLAVRDTSGVALPDRGLQAIALHETGHAIGLPHSGDPGDAMFPSARVVAPSERDRRTAAALYSLPPGDVRDPGDD